MTEQLPEYTVNRFATLGGATVVTVATGTSAQYWQCLGCDEGERFSRHPVVVRKEANVHAGLCRSMPKPSA